MAVSAVLWKLASPYDAYVSHVARLNDAIERIRYYSDRAAVYEVGLRSSTGTSGSDSDPGARVARFRAQLGDAATSMTDEQFEEFIATLGGGQVANAEADRAKAQSRMGYHQRGLEEYFAIAAHELSILEKRDYNPSRGDISRQLKENKLPITAIPEYRQLLHELGARAARRG